MTAGGRRAAWRRPRTGTGSAKRDLSEKGWAPLRYWIFWWTLIGLADVVFYVLLTPVWLGLRALAWLAELRSRARR